MRDDKGIQRGIQRGSRDVDEGIQRRLKGIGVVSSRDVRVIIPEASGVASQLDHPGQ